MKKWLVLTILMGVLSALPGYSQSEEWPGAKSEIEINASPEVVWDAVHQQRASDPDIAYSKVIQEKDNRILLEQKYNALPIIGEATCLMVQEETPLKRIDYKMVRSDKFKAMSGSWILKPVSSGKTILELRSLLDTGLPYSQLVINSLLQEKIVKRLNRVKLAAESVAINKPNSF